MNVIITTSSGQCVYSDVKGVTEGSGLRSNTISLFDKEGNEIESWPAREVFLIQITP